MIEIVDIVVGNDETENHTLVMFSNNSYACSCGIHSQDVKLPSLRKPLRVMKIVTFHFINAGGTPFTVTNEELQKEPQPMTVIEYLQWVTERGSILVKVEGAF